MKCGNNNCNNEFDENEGFDIEISDRKTMDILFMESFCSKNCIRQYLDPLDFGIESD